MAVLWRIPQTSGHTLDISIENDSRVFLVGPNGAGKSTLIQHAVDVLGPQNVRRISAHRQTWLRSSAISMTPQGRKQEDEYTFNRESNPNNRWQDQRSSERLSSVLFDLAAKDNELSRRIRDSVYADDKEALQKIKTEERPVFDEINSLLAIGGLPVSIENSEGEAIIARHKVSSATYGIEQMSDGERNAVILAANVLTVRPGTVILVDEPERHLHRSVIGPFLSALFDTRKDCAFIVSTHDTSLPPLEGDVSVLIVNSCQWKGGAATSWDIRLLERNSGLPEELKRAILGARDAILFVEGETESLDVQLYSALFPNISVIPTRSSDDVIKSVKGLVGATDHHYVNSFGLIDRDNRGVEEITELEKSGIFALNEYSVESLYYCNVAVHAVADWQAKSLGGDSDSMLRLARMGALKALREVTERLAARRCERQVRRQAQTQLPNWRTIMQNPSHTIRLETKEHYDREVSTIQKLVDQGDLDRIVARYPVRESNALDEIVKALELDRERYKRTLLQRIRDNATLADHLRNRIGPLSALLLQEG